MKNYLVQDIIQRLLCFQAAQMVLSLSRVGSQVLDSLAKPDNIGTLQTLATVDNYALTQLVAILMNIPKFAGGAISIKNQHQPWISFLILSFVQLQHQRW